MKKRSGRFYIQLIITIITCAFLIIPVCQSILAGITVNFLRGLGSGVTLKWLVEVWTLYSDTIFRSIFIGVVCLSLALTLGVPAAYVMVKTQNRMTRIIEELLVVPLAVPGLATALAILIMYGQWTAFRRSWTIILVGHVIFTIPFMIRSVIAVMSSYNLGELEESAASLGAGFWNRFFHIAVPNSMPGILSGSLMVFTLSIGEFNLTWMLHTPLTKTLPVGLADSYASMRLEIGSAYTIVFFFMIIPLLIAIQHVASPKRQMLPTTNQKRPKVQSLMKSSGSKQPISLLERPITDTATTIGQDGTSLEITNCAKTFSDGTLALEPIDLAIHAGETIVVLGPSGCGKTTLLRIIAGLEQPDEGGRVYFNDDDVTQVPIEKRNVGMVFQNYALFPNMTVSENIAYGLKIRGDDTTTQKKRVIEMLSMMKIDELGHRQIHQLSGGQKQRVALARAIAVRPRILLLDEPLTALDAKLRDALRVDIDLLLRSIGITSVYVTHDQSEAMALGDRIVVMKQGGICQVGTPRDIYFKPNNRFVAEFVGTLNHIESKAEKNCLRILDSRIAFEEAPQVNFGGESTLDIYFRPEHAVVTDTGKGHLKAEVVTSTFMGDRTLLLVNGSTAERLNVEAPGKRSFRPGEIVDIRLETDSIFTLRD
jgi:putative spermidine/putrescine transport system ATP-binding protein